MKNAPPKESQQTFPCDFQIKVFGLAADHLETLVRTIVLKHAATLSDQAIQSRLSENGNYCALSVTVFVDSKQQLDAIYQSLSSNKQILMVL